VTRLDTSKIRHYQARFRNYIRQSKVPFSDFDEYWLITDEFTEETLTARVGNDRHFRVLELRELRKLFASPRSQSRTGAKGKAKTKIGKAIELNEKEIELAIAGLILQIDDKLEVLRHDRPNSDEAIVSRDLRISDYERMRADLENIREMVAQFKKGAVKEAKVVKSVTTFGEGIRIWWQKGHDSICNRTYDAGLFLSSVGVLSLMNADMKMGMVVAGALIGGKSVAAALKGLPKKNFSARFPRLSFG
jgi:hypothetical protein